MSAFQDQVAVVTGAGSGIGQACAEAFAKRGAFVVVADIDGEAAGGVAEMITAAGGKATSFVVDVSEPDAVEAMLEEADERGGIRILVNNAGVLRLAPITEVTDDAWDFTIKTNLSSMFYCSRGAARRMVARGVGGRIISVSSIHAAVSEPDAGPYTASKGGIEALSRTLASELATHGVTVNCVRPGATWTGLSRPLYTPEVLNALKARIPLREIAQPEWIAAAIIWLASDEARYCTGTTLDVDGGYIMDGSLPNANY